VEGGNQRKKAQSRRGHKSVASRYRNVASTGGVSWWHCTRR